jgi:chemotaxis protein MotB
MRKFLLVVCIGVALIPMSGCSRFGRYVGSFGAVGAAIGGTTGAVTSQSVNAGEGAVMGGVGGGFVGAIVADHYDDTDWAGMEAEIVRLTNEKNDMALALAKKDGLLIERDALLARREAEQGDLAGRLADANARLSAMQTDLDMAQADADRFSKEYVELEGQLVANESLLQAKRDELAELQGRLGDAISVERQGDGIALTILNELLYPLGSAELSPEGVQVLSQTADIIRELYPNNPLVIEGHTDDTPITKSAWKSNWELGAARALNVLHHFVSQEGFAKDRMSAITYADTRPSVPNAMDELKAANRRAVIVILPEDGTASSAANPAAPSTVFHLEPKEDLAVIKPLP